MSLTVPTYIEMARMALKLLYGVWEHFIHMFNIDLFTFYPNYVTGHVAMAFPANSNCFELIILLKFNKRLT